MVPESTKIGADAYLWVLLGYLTVHLFQHVLPLHFHFGEEIHAEHLLQKSAGLSALVGLMVHNFFSGIAIGAGILNGISLGLLVFIGVILHKLPEGFTISSILFASRKDTHYTLPATVLLAFSSLVGTSLVFITGISNGKLLNVILALAAGTFIHVATTDLIPEINLSEKRLSAFMIFLGVIFYYGTHFLIRWSGLE
jgi:zinc transporter ZupT